MDIGKEQEMTRKTNYQLIQKMQDLIVNDEELHLAAQDHANVHLSKVLGDQRLQAALNEDDPHYDENIESLYYALINEFMVTIVGRAISGFNHGVIKSDPPETTD